MTLADNFYEQVYLELQADLLHKQHNLIHELKCTKFSNRDMSVITSVAIDSNVKGKPECTVVYSKKKEILVEQFSFNKDYLLNVVQMKVFKCILPLFIYSEIL